MSSFKKLSKADVTTVNYHANKQWNLLYSSSINDSYAVASLGKNEPFNITGSLTTNGQYQSLIYAEMNHMFYQSYNNTLDTGSIMFNVNTYESASQQRPTASYFNYNANSLFINQFPTGSDEKITVLSINQEAYGSKLLPNSFRISASGVDIRDDGYGNLYDISGVGDDYIDLSYLTIAFINGYFDDLTPGNGVQFVGNVFYAHGIAVITNQDYQNLNPLLTTRWFSRADVTTTTGLVDANLTSTYTIYGNPYDTVYLTASFINPITLPGISILDSRTLTESSSIVYDLKIPLDSSGVGTFNIYLTGSSINASPKQFKGIDFEIVSTDFGSSLSGPTKGWGYLLVVPGSGAGIVGNLGIGAFTTSSTKIDACNNYSPDRIYSFSASNAPANPGQLPIGGVIYDIYPTPLVGGNNWITLKSVYTSLPLKYAFQVDNNGVIIDKQSC